MFSLIPWWLKLLIAGALAVGAVIAWEHFVANPYRQDGRDEEKKLWDADNARRIAATTEIVMDFVAKEKYNDDAAAKRRAVLGADFSALEVRAAAGVGRVVSVPAASARLLDDISVAANADRPATPAANVGGKARADPIPDTAAAVVYDAAERDAYEVAAGKAYRDAYDLWGACRTREDACRATVERLTGGAP